jgi:hypothetical protein
MSAAAEPELLQEAVGSAILWVLWVHELTMVSYQIFITIRMRGMLREWCGGRELLSLCLSHAQLWLCFGSVHHLCSNALPKDHVHTQKNTRQRKLAQQCLHFPAKMTDCHQVLLPASLHMHWLEEKELRGDIHLRNDASPIASSPTATVSEQLLYAQLLQHQFCPFPAAVAAAAWQLDAACRACLHQQAAYVARRWTQAAPQWQLQLHCSRHGACHAS